MLDALARSQEAPGQHSRSFDVGQHRSYEVGSCAVRHDHDLFGVRAVDRDQTATGGLALDDGQRR